MSESALGSSVPVDTAKVVGRRTLRFDSIDQMQAEVDRLVVAEKAGRQSSRCPWTKLCPVSAA